MKKKTLLIISMLVLVMFALTACGGKKPFDVVEDNLKQVKTENASSSVTKLFNDSSLEQKYGSSSRRFRTLTSRLRAKRSMARRQLLMLKLRLTTSEMLIRRLTIR